ncbi:MAG TPA: oligosaccharide flippase family protein, partial [Chloroflexota bacterium]|nr:oligosaccharide flippase family protein [Chloroflexota bacterium]
MITETNHSARPLDRPSAGHGPPPAAPAAAAARRVARNSVVPLAATLGARAMSMLLAAVMARTLGAEGTGAYAVAVNLWLYASIVSDFGLGTWLTREVARAPDADGVRQTVGEALALRLFLSAAAVPSLVAA